MCKLLIFLNFLSVGNLKPNLKPFFKLKLKLKLFLLNRATGFPGCPVSQRRQTTRVAGAWTLWTKDETQVVLVDTPGVVSPEEAARFKLEDSLLAGPLKACRGADAIFVVHDVSSREGDSISRNLLVNASWQLEADS